MDRLHSWFDGSDLVSFLVGALVPTAIYLLQRRRDAQALDYQRRQTETDEGRRRDEAARAAQADIRLTLRREPSPRSRVGDYFLDIQNAGPAIAHDVNLIRFRSLASGEDPPVANADTIFPVPELRPGSALPCHIQVWGSMGSAFEAVVTWDDPRGRQTHTFRMTR